MVDGGVYSPPAIKRKEMEMNYKEKAAISHINSLVGATYRELISEGLTREAVANLLEVVDSLSRLMAKEVTEDEEDG